MEHTLKFKVDESRLRSKIEYEVQRESDMLLRTELCNGKNGSAKGTLYSAIEEAVVEQVLSDKTAAIIKRVIERDWERLLEEATVSALTHKAHKIAFQSAKSPLKLIQECQA